MDLDFLAYYIGSLGTTCYMNYLYTLTLAKLGYKVIIPKKYKYLPMIIALTPGINFGVFLGLGISLFKYGEENIFLYEERGLITKLSSNEARCINESSRAKDLLNAYTGKYIKELEINYPHITLKDGSKIYYNKINNEYKIIKVEGSICFKTLNEQLQILQDNLTIATKRQNLLALKSKLEGIQKETKELKRTKKKKK